ncbi:MAG TPA: energy transducer TonB [Thiobacillaceae bacterium]|nr:energy transducer TonB [Thiobacillaceae bacterium]
MHGDRFLPLTSGVVRPQLVERHQWLAFFASVGLHLLVLLSLPWLMQTEPLPQPMEIEVQLEREPPLMAQIQRPASHARRRNATRSVQASRSLVAKRQPATRLAALKEMQVELKEVRKRKIRPAGHTTKLASSAMKAQTPANQPGAAPQGAGSDVRKVAKPGPTWRTNAPASPPPRPAYAGWQPSIAQASVPQPGENSSPGPKFLAGSTPAVQSVAPEYRHAARPGGKLGSQGGALQPFAGLNARANEARPGGWQSPSANRTSDGGANHPGKEPGKALAAAASGGGIPAINVAGSGGGTLNSRGSGAGSGGKGGSTAIPGEQQAGGLTGSLGRDVSPVALASGTARSGHEGSGGRMGGSRHGGSENGAGNFQLALGDGGRSPHGGLTSQQGQLAGEDAPVNASIEGSESSKPTMQLASADIGSARLLEDRYTATPVKVASPTHFCQIPLLMAGLGGPIPKDLDSIMPSPSTMAGEFPPQHLPGNQMPVYPPGAIVNNLHGKVILRAEVLTSGAVGTILLKQSSGAQILDAAAYETVHHWRFQPAQRNGQPVVAWMTVPIEYRNPQTLNGAKP